MPGPWIYLGDNKDFYANPEILPATYMETILYDASGAEQGHGLWRIISADQKRKEDERRFMATRSQVGRSIRPALMLVAPPWPGKR